MIDAAAARAAAAEYADLPLDRVGIPMVLALLDETDADPIREPAGPAWAPAGAAGVPSGAAAGVPGGAAAGVPSGAAAGVPAGAAAGVPGGVGLGGSLGAAAGGAGVEDGAAFARLLDAYREVLEPGAADGDLSALHHVLAVLSWVHRPGGPAAVSPPGDDPPAPGLGFARHRAALAAGRFVRVVNYHNTPAGTADELERDLRRYLDRYDPVTPEDLETFFDTGRWPTARPGFVAAFYDGYRNHVTVAAPVCDRLGLRAWFLPPTALLDSPPQAQHAFAAAHDVDVVPEEAAAERLAMTPAELGAIARRHVVAAHTATHASVEEVAADPDGELAGARDRIAAVTGTTPTAVALRLGAPYAAGVPQWDAARATGYRLVVSNTAIQRI